jgi:hypothetical protein
VSRGLPLDLRAGARTPFTVVSDTQLTAIAPAHAAGAVDVLVTTPAGTSPPNPNDLFTYLS